MGKKLFFSPQINRQFIVIASMVVSSVLCISMLAIRIVHTQRFTHTYLLWNLFLAWLPLVSALISYNLHLSSPKRTWLLVIFCACLWLVFLPNAPYLITDLVHLHPGGEFIYWFDLIMFFAFAWNGIFLGLISLYLMQELVDRVAGQLLSWGFVLIVSFLSSFGIYMGRFLRWNSWDLATQPAELVGNLLDGVWHPYGHLRTLAFSLLFTLFLTSSYLMLVAVTRFNHVRPERD
ncbi:MAG TPA: DUF1361 domain-containing protein [Blastocatellia bacterium]|nr:DUF1361 domain-containing protein [Blastocatellia bacterium]